MSEVPARALVVEDDRSWQQIVTEILTDLGLAVDVADTLEAAVGRWPRRRTGSPWSICR